MRPQEIKGLLSGSSLPDFTRIWGLRLERPFYLLTNPVTNSPLKIPLWYGVGQIKWLVCLLLGMRKVWEAHVNPTHALVKPAKFLAGGSHWP